MAPLTKDQKKALWKSGLALLVVAVVMFLLLAANKPAKKQVRFDAVCKSFVAPVAFTLKLHDGPGEVQEAIAEGFDATIANMESVALTLDGDQLGKMVAQGFQLERNHDANQTPAHLDVTPNGDLGRTELQVSSGTVISSFGSEDTRPWVKADSGEGQVKTQDRGQDQGGDQGQDLQMVLVSPTSVLKGNRYVVSGISSTRLPKKVVDNLEADVKGAIPGTLVGLKSEDPGASVKVLFRPEMEEIPLFRRRTEGESQEQASQSGEVNNVSLLLHGCVNPDLRIGDEVGDKSATGVIADRRTNLKIEAIAGTIDAIGIAGGVEKNDDSPRLRVRGLTRASSLEQDGHELLPTLVGEVMDLPYTQRGAALIVLGFVLFLTFKVVDRTLGVLLEYFFPKV
jgi:hypothetical protein